VGGLDLDSRSSGCARLGGGVGLTILIKLELIQPHMAQKPVLRGVAFYGTMLRCGRNSGLLSGRNSGLLCYDPTEECASCQSAACGAAAAGSGSRVPADFRAIFRPPAQ